MQLRDRVLQHLATPQAEPRFGRPYLVAEVARETGCREHEVWEALWGLVGEGLVYLDPGVQGSGTDNWRWKLSSVGVSAVESGNWEPRDPEGYLRRLRCHSPEIDPLVLRYVEEALRAFNARCYLATSVMLGVASERILEQLARSVIGAEADRSTKLRKALDNPRESQFTRFTELRKVLEPRRADLPDGLGDTLTLDAVADLLRIARNEAGHPSAGSIDEETAYTHLQMAARYLQKITLLRGFFDGDDRGA